MMIPAVLIPRLIAGGLIAAGSYLLFRKKPSTIEAERSIDSDNEGDGNDGDEANPDNDSGGTGDAGNLGNVGEAEIVPDAVKPGNVDS